MNLSASFKLSLDVLRPILLVLQFANFCLSENCLYWSPFCHPDPHDCSDQELRELQHPAS